MDALLLAVIAIKAVCILFCWKAMSGSKKQEVKTENRGNSTSTLDLTDEEAKAYQEKMSKMIEQNKHLKDELEELKK